MKTPTWPTLHVGETADVEGILACCGTHARAKSVHGKLTLHLPRAANIYLLVARGALKEQGTPDAITEAHSWARTHTMQAVLRHAQMHVRIHMRARSTERSDSPLAGPR
eukprot:1424717-Alexandrium_andersonii.AAC.1